MGEVTEPDRDLDFDEGDDAALVPKCVVVDSQFDWERRCPPLYPLA
jgi:hypothetical protein